MSQVWSALSSYLYGIGWLVIVLCVLPMAIRSVLGLFGMGPADARRELEKQNLAFGLAAGLFLLGLALGLLYFAAHVS